MSDRELAAPQSSEAGSEPAAPPARRRGPLRRIGCAVGVVVWALLIMTPTIAIILLTQGEISISTGPAPEQRLRVWLIMEASQRGLGISNATTSSSADGQICVQTSTNFVLWQGRGEAASYCECYARTDNPSGWTLISVAAGNCRP